MTHLRYAACRSAAHADTSVEDACDMIIAGIQGGSGPTGTMTCGRRLAPSPVDRRHRDGAYVSAE